jgi:hypothetical protein
LGLGTATGLGAAGGQITGIVDALKNVVVKGSWRLASTEEKPAVKNAVKFKAISRG